MECCPYCGSSRLREKGTRDNKKRYFCNNCHRYPSADIETTTKKHAPKIIVLDIETMIKKAFLFRAGKQYVNADNFVDKDTMICWSAKILGDDKIFGDCLTVDEARNKNHSRITKSLWDTLSDADFVISHNGLHFDIPMIMTFFLRDRLGVPNRFRNIDTCSTSRKIFKFESNRLDFIVRHLGLNSGKSDTNIQLWIDCYNAENNSPLKKMFDYNKNDVSILEDLFLEIRPYISGFSNIGVWGETNESVCPYCGGMNFSEKGYFYTPNGKFNSYRCECQGIFRSKENLLSKQKRKNQFITQ